MGARPVGLLSTDYLAAHGTPTDPSQLNDHACVLFTRISGGEVWRFEGPQGRVSVQVQGRLRSNSSDAAREATLAGLGIAVLPTWHFPDGVVPAGHRQVLTLAKQVFPRPPAVRSPAQGSKTNHARARASTS